MYGSQEKEVEMKEGEVVIRYKLQQGVDTNLDMVFDSIMQLTGRSRWASGKEIETGIRDLNYEYKKGSKGGR